MYRPLEINVFCSTGLSSYVKSEVLMTVKMNVSVFLDVTPCGFVCTNFWKDRAASIFRVQDSSALKVVLAVYSESFAHV
jgi:hypothetical protein